MAESGRLTEAEMSVIFVNWRELIMCNTKLLKWERESKQHLPSLRGTAKRIALKLIHLQEPFLRCLTQLKLDCCWLNNSWLKLYIRCLSCEVMLATSFFYRMYLTARLRWQLGPACLYKIYTKKKMTKNLLIKLKHNGFYSPPDFLIIM